MELTSPYPTLTRDGSRPPHQSYLKRMNNKNSKSFELPSSRNESFHRFEDGTEGSLQGSIRPLFRKSPSRQNDPNHTPESTRKNIRISRFNSRPMSSQANRCRSLAPSMRSRERSQTQVQRKRSTSQTLASMDASLTTTLQKNRSRSQTPVRRGSNFPNFGQGKLNILGPGRVDTEIDKIINIKSSPIRSENVVELPIIPSYINNLGLKNNVKLTRVKSLPLNSHIRANLNHDSVDEFTPKSFIATMQKKDKPNQPLRPKHQNDTLISRASSQSIVVPKTQPKNNGDLSKARDMLSDILEKEQTKEINRKISKENDVESLSTGAAIGKISGKATMPSSTRKIKQDNDSASAETRFWTQISIQVSTAILQSGGSEKEAEIGQLAVLTTGQNLTDTSTESVNYAASKVSMALMEHGAESSIIAAATMGCLKQFDKKPPKASFIEMAKESFYGSSEALKQGVKYGVENGTKYLGVFSQRAMEKYEEVAQMLEESRQYEEEMRRGGRSSRSHRSLPDRDNRPRRSRSVYKPRLENPIEYDRRRTDDPRYYSPSPSRRRSRSPGRRNLKTRMNPKDRYRNGEDLSSSASSSSSSSDTFSS